MTLNKRFNKVHLELGCLHISVVQARGEDREKAIKLYFEKLKEWEELYEKLKPQFFSQYNETLRWKHKDLAWVYEIMGDLDKAKENEEKAKAIYKARREELIEKNKHNKNYQYHPRQH